MDGDDFTEFLGESPGFSPSTDDIFTILQDLETSCDYNQIIEQNDGLNTKDGDGEDEAAFEFQNTFHRELEAELDNEAAANSPKRQKMMMMVTSNGIHNNGCSSVVGAGGGGAGEELGQQKMSHITVERNRRKQMNGQLAVLRALMPCFYVKRGDQASIIGGVVDYITELQQILQSLEAKKQRKAYTEVLSPRIISSPHPSQLSPRIPPRSPRLSLPISPRTPQPSSPYKARLHNLQPSFLNSPSLPSPIDPSPCNSSTSSINDSINELVASSKSAVAEVEVKFSGPNLLLKTASHRVMGQASKIVSALEELALEILQVNINTVEKTMLYSFTIKIGIDCQLSAEELADQIQQTFN